jgi:hypothetical protein
MEGKKTADLKGYLKEYREKNKVKCEVCNGSYNKYTEAKHLLTKKHQKSKTKKEAKFNIEINKDDVIKFLEERFESSAKSDSSVNNKNKRVNKSLYIWKKLFDVADKKDYDWFLENRIDLVKKAYNTPSSQSAALSTLKIVLDYIHPLGDMKKVFYDEGKALIDKYLDEAVLKHDGMTYEDLAKYETSEDPEIALFAHLYNKNNNALRLGDYINTVVGKSKTMNFIDLKKGTLTRRISKVMPDPSNPDIIKLPSELIEYIKQKNIKGNLFGDYTLEEIVKKVAKILGEGHGSRYWRRMYITEIVSEMKKSEKIQIAKNMNHSVETATLVYDRKNKKK